MTVVTDKKLIKELDELSGKITSQVSDDVEVTDQNLIKELDEIVNDNSFIGKETKTVGAVYQFYQSVYAIVWELAKSVVTLTPPDMEKIGSEFNDIKTSWDSYLQSGTNGFKALTGQDFKDPKELEKVDKKVKMILKIFQQQKR